MKIYKFSVGALSTNSYLCVDEATQKAFITDPGGNADRLLSAIKDKNAVLEYVILTHGHFDHILALNEIIAETGARVLIHGLDAGMLMKMIAATSATAIAAVATQVTIFFCFAFFCWILISCFFESLGAFTSVTWVSSTLLSLLRLPLPIV